MNLLRLLGRLGQSPLRRLVIGAVASALSSAIVLAIVNVSAARIAARHEDVVDLRLAALFVAGVLLYAAAETWIVSRMGADVEAAIDDLRCRLLERLRHASLAQLEGLGETALFESITQSSQAISMNSQFLALSLRSVLLIVAVMIYIATVSTVAFQLIAASLSAGAALYWWLGLAVHERQQTLMGRESELFEAVSDLFDGFKEQRMNSARSRDLNAVFGRVSTALTQARDDVHQHNWQQFVIGETAYNLMLGAIVFLVPKASASFGQDVVKVTAACLFMASSVFGLMQSMAVLSEADGAAGRMLDLEGTLLTVAEPGSDQPGQPVAVDFHEIRLAGVAFAFPAAAGERPFGVGPLDVAIRRGETVFVTGGNGSGKSTFLKLLTSLYAPASGQVLLDDVEIGATELAGYRALIATVFTDFHLFARLHDLQASGREDAAGLLRWMELDLVVGFDGERFSRRDLSTGQRKRLALVAALLEQKPVLVLDEFAADQDPQFRRRFYREILPELKRRGLTIVAVTHDDQYFDLADRRLHMEGGDLRELPAGDGGAQCA